MRTGAACATRHHQYELLRPGLYAGAVARRGRCSASERRQRSSACYPSASARPALGTSVATGKHPYDWARPEDSPKAEHHGERADEFAGVAKRRPSVHRMAVETVEWNLL